MMAVATASVGLAAPAAADQEEFVRPLLARYVFLSEQQLLSEGAKVCDATQSGKPASVVTTMVRDDLGVSVSAAAQIVSTAIVELDC
jgi:uncharacterized protein DUF732